MKTILIIGSTGAMGTTVARALLGDKKNEWHVVGLTRNTESQHARDLLNLTPERVSLVKGDVDDIESLRVAMSGVDAVFCNTAFFSTASVPGEHSQGMNALNVANELGIDHFIYSSLDAVTRISDGRLSVPHYDAKAAVEAEIDKRRSDEFMKQESHGWYRNHVSVLVACPYIENFNDFFVPRDGSLPDGRRGKIFHAPMTGNGKWQMVALEDLGEFARIMFADRKQWGGRTLRIASEELSMQEIVEQFEETTGIPAVFHPMSDDEFRGLGSQYAHDLLNNILMYRDGDYGERDYARLKQLNPSLRSFRSWLAETGWKGESRPMRKNAADGDA